MSPYASMRDDVVMNVCTPVDDDVCVVTMRSDEHEDFPDREGGLFDECVRRSLCVGALREIQSKSYRAPADDHTQMRGVRVRVRICWCVFHKPRVGHSLCAGVL
jgi:hypothetical protein